MATRPKKQKKWKTQSHTKDAAQSGLIRTITLEVQYRVN